MSDSLEQLVQSAKKTGAATGIGIGVFSFKFGRKPSPVGLFRTGLYLPDRSFVDRTLIRVDTAIAGAAQLPKAFQSSIAPKSDRNLADATAAGVFIESTTRVNVPTQKELILNISAAITAGEFTCYVKYLPY